MRIKKKTGAVIRPLLIYCSEIMIMCENLQQNLVQFDGTRYKVYHKVQRKKIAA